jgi:hypothetical protein
MTTSATAKRLVEKSRKLADQRQQNLVDQIGRFNRLDVGMWRDKYGPGATVFDTGHEDENGAEGDLVVVGTDGGCVVGYVWDATVQIKRWISVRTMAPHVEAAP